MKKTTKKKAVPSKYRSLWAHAAKHARMKVPADDPTAEAIIQYLAEKAVINHTLMVKIAIVSEALRAVELWMAEQEMSGKDMTELDDLLGAFYELLDSRRASGSKRSKRPARPARRKK